MAENQNRGPAAATIAPYTEGKREFSGKSHLPQTVFGSRDAVGPQRLSQFVQGHPGVCQVEHLLVFCVSY